MTDDDRILRARDVALAGALNALLKHLGPDAIKSVQDTVFGEIELIAAEDLYLKNEALGFLDEGIPALKWD
ncbi:MAG: hypothetical protein WAP03_13285 [Methylorubrum rhodinum]|uniref:hypothetical protein n=1 Tax=Methylorubrum rhodinum TaxID=29428 RepID=UPI003BB10576